MRWLLLQSLCSPFPVGNICQETLQCITLRGEELSCSANLVSSFLPIPPQRCLFHKSRSMLVPHFLLFYLLADPNPVPVPRPFLPGAYSVQVYPRFFV